MKIKMTIAAFVLTLSPALAFAEGCSGMASQEQAAMSCAEGMSFDAEQNACVADTTS